MAAAAVIFVIGWYPQQKKTPPTKKLSAYGWRNTGLLCAAVNNDNQKPMEMSLKAYKKWLFSSTYQKPMEINAFGGFFLVSP